MRGGKQPPIEEDGTGREHGHGLQIEDGTGQAQAWERVLWPCSGSSLPSVTLTTTATSSTTPTSSSVSAYAPPAQSVIQFEKEEKRNNLQEEFGEE